MTEDEMLLSYLGDKMTQCEKEEAVAYSYFLDSRQRMIAEKFCSSKWQGHYLFWGGYEDSERAVCFFLPWYLQREQFMEQPEEYAPLALLRVQNKSGAVLSHRDYLGALMALGIKRELVGDILVFQQGCDIIVFDKIAFYVKTNYEKVGNAGLAVKEVPIAQICREEQRRERLQLTAASLRLDVLVSAIFHLSRAKAAECISGGQVFLNGALMEKPEKTVQEKDKIVLRGKGKVVITEIGGKTRKDKISLWAEKYI